jgi:hypothetical protein
MSLAPAVGVRASDAERERAVRRLHRAAVEGRLDAEELEERVGRAYAARWREQLAALLVDVTPPPEPRPLRPVRVAGAQPFRARTVLNPLAATSLLCALIWAMWLGSLAAVVLGHVALAQIARSGGTQTGRGAAVAGLVLGYLGLLALGIGLLGALA